MRKTIFFLLSLLFVVHASAQSPAAGANWDHLKALPVSTNMHVSGDRMSRTCHLVSVDDEQLVCSRGRVIGTAHYTFARAEVKSVKLTRYAVSTLGGAAIGLGAGTAIGFAVAPPEKNSFLDFSGTVRAIAIVGGGVVGGAVLGPTDAFRGPTVYRREK